MLVAGRYVHPNTLFARLSKITDYRFSQWKIYPLNKILSLLILAAVCGERSLRGMWLWAVNRWEEVREMMDLPPRPPALSTVWYILRKVDKQQLAEALATEGSDEEIGVDGKSMRGSKRKGEEALAVVTACGQRMKEVLYQLEVEGGDEIEAALRLLMEIDLDGKIITLDAKLTQKKIVNHIVEEEGDYIGILKGNHPQLLDAIQEWIRDQREDAGVRNPDFVEWDKGHGRIEKREIWLVDAEEMEEYVQDVFGWKGLRLCGYVRRYRMRSDGEEWESDTTTTFVSSLRYEEVSPSGVSGGIRRHWSVENGVFRVRDVSYEEDRLHSRKIAYHLSQIRNGAMTLIRRAGFRYIPDGGTFLPGVRRG